MNCDHGIRKGTCILCRRLWAHRNYGHMELVEWPKSNGLFDFNFHGEGYDGVAKAITAGTQLDRDIIQHSRKSAGVDCLPHKHKETEPRHRQIPWLAARLGSPAVAVRFREVAEHFSFDYKMTLKMIGEIQVNPLKLLELEFLWTETKDKPAEIEFSQAPLWNEAEEENNQNTPLELESDFRPSDEYRFHRAEPLPSRSWYAFQRPELPKRPRTREQVLGRFLDFIWKITHCQDVAELRKLKLAAEKSVNFQKRSVALYWIRRQERRIKTALSPAARYLIVRLKKGQKMGRLLYQIQKGEATTPHGRPVETEWPVIWATFREHRA